MITKHQARLVTLLYSDIFDFPLTQSEARYWSVYYEDFAGVSGETKNKGEFLVFPGRENCIETRTNRKKWAKKKWVIAKRVALVLRYVPTIELIGVTGGLAMDNTPEDDDIDLFFIVSPGTIWISRLITTLLVELLGKRRRWGDTTVKDTVCLNMFMSSGSLALSKKEQDVYTAHEVLQMQPLFDRSGVYRRFLEKNRWAKMFLPNAWNEQRKKEKGKRKQGAQRKTFTFSLLPFPFRLLEPLARVIQLFYMKNHRTTEVVTSSVLRFHPNDARVWVKKALTIRLKQHNIPLDKTWNGD